MNKKNNKSGHFYVQLATHIIFFTMLAIVFIFIIASIFIDKLLVNDVLIKVNSSVFVFLGLYIATISFVFAYKIYINTKAQTDEEAFLKELYPKKEKLEKLIKMSDKIEELLINDKEEADDDIEDLIPKE